MLTRFSTDPCNEKRAAIHTHPFHPTIYTQGEAAEGAATLQNAFVETKKDLLSNWRTWEFTRMTILLRSIACDFFDLSERSQNGMHIDDMPLGLCLRSNILLTYACFHFL
jgi:hypothetical protein